MLNLFLNSVLGSPFPSPGESFEVCVDSDNPQSSRWRFTRPDDSDSQLDHVSAKFIADFYFYLFLFKKMLFIVANAF